MTTTTQSPNVSPEDRASMAAFDACEAAPFGWDGAHVEDAVRFARMYRRLYVAAVTHAPRPGGPP